MIALPLRFRTQQSRPFIDVSAIAQIKRFAEAHHRQGVVALAGLRVAHLSEAPPGNEDVRRQWVMLGANLLQYFLQGARRFVHPLNCLEQPPRLHYVQPNIIAAGGQIPPFVPGELSPATGRRI